MSGLSVQDMRVLERYALRGNRELYWNYLAQHAGADGYGLLALGVVRNDSMPGAVANHFADNRARQDGRELTERDWERFGEDLIRRDLALRAKQMAQHRPDLALNLPVDDVQRAHDGALREAGIDPNAWTPRQLLEAARRQGGTEAAEQVWHNMLDGRGLGLGRMGMTTWDIAVRYNDAELPATRYLGALGAASALAAGDRSRTDPDVIGSNRMYFQYDRRTGTWSQYSSSEAGVFVRDVTDPRELRELNDARAVRLESQAQRSDFHPDDPNRGRPIARSRFTFADAGDRATDTERHASAARPDVLDALSPGDRALFDRIRRDVPASIGDERVAEAMLAARHSHIDGAQQVARVAVADERILILGTLDTGSARVALDGAQPPLPLSHSVQQTDALNQQRDAHTALAAAQREASAPVRG